MAERVVPMIHVPDVRATVDWYRDIGFNVIGTYDHAGEDLSFAVVSFGSTQVMFSEGGQPSSQHRREVDLYVYSDNVDDLYERLKDRVEVVEGLHETFYGMREFIIRDLNRFWITFGQQTVFDMLMTGIREGKTELVKEALSAAADRGGLKPEALTAALVAASSGDHQNTEITELLKEVGAVPPPEVDEGVLQSHVGKYKSEQGLEVNIKLQYGTLFAEPTGQQSISLVLLNETTFKPTAFEGVTVKFNMDAGKTTGFALNDGSNTTHLKRVEET